MIFFHCHYLLLQLILHSCLQGDGICPYGIYHVSTMFSYDLVSDTWTQEPSLPGKRSGSFSTYVTSRDWIIVLGGKDVTGPISNDEALMK